MNLIKRYIYLITVSICLAFLYAFLTTSISIETLLNWSLFVVPSMMVFNCLIILSILVEMLSILKELSKLEIKPAYLPLALNHKTYITRINIFKYIKEAHLKTVVIRC
jgi:hypothetical protein